MIIAGGFWRLEKSISMSLLTKEDVGHQEDHGANCLEAKCWITKDSEDNQKLQQAAKWGTSTSDDI